MCNAVLVTMDASFKKLCTISGNLVNFGNDLLVALGSTFPFPEDRRVGDWVREHLR